MIKKSYRIALVAPYLSTIPELDEYQSQQLNIACSLSEYGHDVTVITADRGFELPQEKGFKIVGLKIVDLIPISILNQPALRGLYKYMRSNEFDIIQVNEFHSWSTLVIAYAIKNTSSKMIIYQGMFKRSDNLAKKYLLKVFEGLFAKIIRNRVDKVISKTVRAHEFINSLGISKSEVIPVGVNTDIFRPVDRLNKHDIRVVKLLMVGNFIERKNHLLLLDSLLRLKVEGLRFHLTLIGKGKLQKRLEKFISNNGLERNITIINRVDNKSMYKFYNNCDYSLLISHNEIFGMTILESLACGTPVIGSDEPGSQVVLSDKRLGDIVRTTSSKDMAQDLVQIFSRQFDSSNIVKLARSSYSWPSIVSRYTKLYHELCE